MTSLLEYTTHPFTTSDVTTMNISTIYSTIKYNYLVKIDEDYKIITGCFMKQSNLEKIIKTYYPDFTIEITTLNTIKSS